MNKSSRVFTMVLVGAVIMVMTSWQPIPDHQSYTKESYTKVSSLHDIYSEPVFVKDQRTITLLPPRQVFIKERPEIIFNNDLTQEQKIVNPNELEKTEIEKVTVKTESKQATTKSPEHSNLKSATSEMGDTRIVNGQKQVYFLGFGWIEDDNKPNEEITAKDMFENGNKVGTMGDSTVLDSDGDIDKMVGTMGN